MTFNIRYYVSFARYFHRIFCCCRLTSRATANVHSLNFCRLSISPVHEFSPFRSMPVSFPQLFQILQQQIRQRKKELLGKMEFSGWQRCANKHYSVIHYITSVNWEFCIQSVATFPFDFLCVFPFLFRSERKIVFYFRTEQDKFAEAKISISKYILQCGRPL